MICDKYNVLTQPNLISAAILKLPKKEQDLENAYWSLHYLNDYRWKQDPTPPQKFIDYMKLPEDTKKKMNKNPKDYNALWEDEVVKFFLDNREQVRSYNHRNKEHLEWMKGILQKDYPKEVLKIDLLLSEHKDHPETSGTISRLEHPDPINVSVGTVWREV